MSDRLAEERRYTLDEAQAELNRRECAQSGHSYEVLETMGKGPAAVICIQCGERWAIQ